MSYEYFAKIDGSTEVVLPKIFQAEEIRNRASILETEQNQITLRWIDESKRDEWPEDISVNRIDDGFIVSFRTGSAAQRNEFVSLLTKLISLELKVDVEFEET